MQDDKTDKQDKPAISGSLDSRIAQFEARKAGKKQARSKAQMPTQGLALAGRVMIELVAGLAVGGFIGWVLDRWFGTTPLFLVLLFFIGAGAGMMNVWRTVSGYGLAAGYFDKQDQSQADQDDNRSD